MARVPVETVLSARDVNTVAMFQRLAGAAQKYEAVVGQAKSAFNSFQQLATGGTVLALGAGFVSAATGLTKLNKELESTTNQLAGSIQVYKFAANYNDALLMAEGTLRRIKKDAADLPGTDTDFIRSFSINFPEQAQRGVKTLDEAINRSNRLTAVLLTKGVDSNQIGRDLGLMMRGQAGADVRSFMELKGQMGVKDAAAFNALSAQKRFEKLDEVIKKNKDGIDAFADTWEAVSSTSESYMKSLVIAGSKPLFEEAKKNLKAMNDYLGKSMERVSEMAELFGAMTVSSVKALGGVLGNTGSALLSRSAAEGTLQSAGGVLNTLANFASTVISLLSPLGEVISAISNAALGLLVPLVGGVASVIDAWASIAGLVFKNALGLLASVVDVIAPGLAFFGSAVQGLYTAISDIIILLAAKAKPYADKIVEWMRKLVDALVKAANWIATKTGHALVKASNWIATKTGQSSVIGEIQARFKELHSKADNAREYLGVSKVDAVGGISGYIKKFYEEREQKARKAEEELVKAEKNAAKPKRPSITQDFRGSKFSIEQNFATGFDPGRVLTAVREDAAALAQRRLTAGTTPLFGANI